MRRRRNGVAVAGVLMMVELLVMMSGFVFPLMIGLCAGERVVMDEVCGLRGTMVGSRM